MSRTLGYGQVGTLRWEDLDPGTLVEPMGEVKAFTTTLNDDGQIVTDRFITVLDAPCAMVIQRKYAWWGVVCLVEEQLFVFDLVDLVLHDMSR